MESACCACMTTCWTRSAATIPATRCVLAWPANSPQFWRRGSTSCSAGAQVPTTFEVVVDSSQTLSAAFRQNALDVAFVVGTGDSEPHRIEQWRGQLRWFGQTFEGDQDDRPAPLVLAPQGSPFHEAATGALRAQGRKFEIVCTSSSFTVLAAAAAAGLGVTPMIEGLAPEGLEPCPDKSLPALPEVTLLLLARSQALAVSSRRWVASVVDTLHRTDA